MKTAIGTKVVRFEPMTKGEFQKLFRRVHPDNSPVEAEGYHVQYDNPDGSVYDSWSPKNVFDDAYRALDDGLTFGDALFFLKKGKGVRLPSWSADVVIRCQFPDENSKMTAPYLYVESRFGRVPWKETMIELFSEKWMVVDA